MRVCLTYFEELKDFSKDAVDQSWGNTERLGIPTCHRLGRSQDEEVRLPHRLVSSRSDTVGSYIGPDLEVESGDFVLGKLESGSTELD